MAYTKILAVVHPFRDDTGAVSKAATIARGSAAQIHLHSVVWEADFAQHLFHLSTAAEQRRQQLLDAAQARLQALAARHEAPGSHCDVTWGHPFDELVLGVIKAQKPDLIVLDVPAHHALGTAQWRLIHGCQTPLLLCRNTDWSTPPHVAACVDPTHAHDKPADVDQAVITAAERLEHCLGSPYEILHAAGMTPNLHGDQPYTYQYREQVDGEREARIRDLLPPDKSRPVEVNFSHSTPVEAIAAFISERQVDLCVLGQVNRSRWKELLIGSTPRALIAKVDCDFLLLPHPWNTQAREA